jgi:hypothetical protein
MNTSVDPLKLAEKYWNDIPVPVFQILNELGLGPEIRPLPEETSGWIEKMPTESYWVVINSYHHLVRQRFTAAHELGHYIYHRDLLGDGVGDNRAYRQDGTFPQNSAIRPMHERQANSFAANLLMPSHSISALRTKGIVEVADLASSFEVSKDAMRIRLGIPRA